MPVGYRSTQNPRDATQNQRDLIWGRGDELNQEFRDQGDQANQRANGYANFLDPIEQEMAQGGGGYSLEEQQAIRGDTGPQALSNLPTSQQDLQSNFLSPEEQAGMKGDTGSYTDYLNPDAMHNSLAGDQARQDTAVSNLRGDLGNAIRPNDLRQSQGYQNAVHDQLNANTNNVRGAVSSQGANTRGVVGATQGNVRGAIDPAALRQSEAAAKNEVMTPEEEQRMVTAAGIDQGVRNQAAVGSLERNARAAGTNPLGVAAYRARMNKETAAEAGDAMTKARVAARGERAQEALGSESQRVGAEQQLAGLRTGTEMQLGQQGLQNEQQLGQENLAAEQGLGQQALTQANQQEANRQGAEQYLTGAEMQAGTTAGEAELQNAQAKAAQEQQQNQFVTNTGTNTRIAQDQANANRAAAVAGNRQQTNEGNQATQFGQGLQVNNAGSQRATQIGNARLNQQNTGLQLQQNAQQQQNQNAQAGYGRQLGTYGTQTGGSNQATGLGIQAQGVPTTTDKVVGGITGAIGAAASFLDKGGVVEEPTEAVIGEHGPEMVVKMDGYRARMSRPVAPRPMRKPMRYGHKEVA